MGLKKPLFLLTSSNFFPSLTCCRTQTSTPPAHLSSSCTQPASNPSRRRRRYYATISHDSIASPNDALFWPEPTKPSSLPSPYQIFNQKHGEPYSKLRFYELVKLYHPDRNNHWDQSSETPNPCKCPRAVMLERYRLVIAANAILSDPVKRDAYDRFGWGWTSRDGRDPSSSDAHIYKYSTQHRWRKDGAASYHWPADQDPMYNATWEDWERWYRQQAFRARASSASSSSSATWTGNFFSPGARQHTVFTNNYAFVSLVLLLAALGGAGQATRVSEESRSRMERTQLINDETSKLLMRARQDAVDQSEGGETKDQRIRRFLRDKEAYSDGEFDGRALREGDDGLCASGVIKSRDEPRFWQKPPER